MTRPSAGQGRKITVPQVMRLMGVRMTNRDTWSAGLRVQALWAKEFGEQPPKDNRPKTRGRGVHCFAIYPESWRPIIEDVIVKMKLEKNGQLDLFVEAQRRAQVEMFEEART